MTLQVNMQRGIKPALPSKAALTLGIITYFPRNAEISHNFAGWTEWVANY
jgi:hypothetical protein